MEPTPRGLRVEWRDGGGRTRLVGVTELGRMIGTDPNLALSVLDSLGRWEAGRSAWCMDPHRKGCRRLHDRAGETSSSSISTSSGGRTPPPRPQRKNPATSRVARNTPPPPPKAQQQQAQGQGRAQGQGQGQSHSPPPQTPSLPPAR